MACVRPKLVNNIVVPCRKCFKCRKRDRDDWSLRVQHEIKDGTFITLTYAPEHYTGQLEKQHLINYLKRIREHARRNDKNFNKKFIYFAVGEYGPNFTCRAHYHIICNYKNHQILKEKWKYGFSYIGDAEGASINYSTKYIQKKKEKEKKRTEPFRIMSKGIGMSYINKHYNFYRKNKQLWITVLIDGKPTKFPLPRYYKDKFFKDKWTKDYFEVDLQTGEFKQYYKLEDEGIDISKEQEQAALNAMKNLKNIYYNEMIKNEDQYLEMRYKKYNEMYKTLKQKRNEHFST